MNHQVLQHENYIGYNTAAYSGTWWSRFITWAGGQEKNRFGWLGVTLMLHGCFLTPLTVMAVVSNGNILALLMLALTAMGASLVSNLAAMPTKYTIPVFFLSVLVDIGVIAAAFALG
jgi:hypothetical protein